MPSIKATSLLAGARTPLGPKIWSGLSNADTNLMGQGMDLEVAILNVSFLYF